MGRIRVDVHNIITNVIVNEGDENDIPVVNNVFVK